MAVNAKAAFSALMAPDIFRVYVDTGKERPLEYTQWANITDMPWNPIKDQQVAGLPTMPDKPEGSRFETRQPLLGASKEHTANPRGMAVEFTWEAWDDELYGIMLEEARELRRSSNNRMEVDAHDVLNNAFSTSYTGFTAGEALCQTGHTTLSGATWDNAPSSSQSFSETYLQGMQVRFHNMIDEQGLPRLMSPVSHIIGPDDIFEAREILGSSGTTLVAGSNAINSLIQDETTYMVSHYLDTVGYHFTLAAKGVHDLQFGIKNAPMFDNFDDPWTKNAVFTVYQRNTLGYFNSSRGVDGAETNAAP